MHSVIRKQEGIALPVAAGMMLVVSLLVAAFFSSALQLGTSANKDRAAKQAISAAEAGLQSAAYRMNLIRPAIASNMCLTSTATSPVGGECPGHTETLGNGAQYTYYVTPQMGVGGTCTLKPGVAALATDRCITSVGTVNGVSRRVQARLSQIIGPSIWNSVGLMGKSLLFAYNSITMLSDVGSNTKVHLENSVVVDGDPALSVTGRVKLAAGGIYEAVNSVSVEGGAPPPYEPAPFQIAARDYESVDGDVVGENNNNLLTGAQYNAATKAFVVTSGEYTVPEGTYHLCRLHLGNSVKLKFTHTTTTPTKIYIDDYTRPGSPCPVPPASGADNDTAGTFTADNSVEINKEVGEREDLLEVYLYGTGREATRSYTSAAAGWACDSPFDANDCKADFMLDNSVTFYGTVEAPNSSAGAHNSVNIVGGIAADKIRLYNSVNFSITAETRAKPAPAPGPATRQGWVECKSAPSTPSDPESGC